MIVHKDIFKNHSKFKNSHHDCNDIIGFTFRAITDKNIHKQLDFKELVHLK